MFKRFWLAVAALIGFSGLANAQDQNCINACWYAHSACMQRVGDTVICANEYQACSLACRGYSNAGDPSAKTIAAIEKMRAERARPALGETYAACADTCWSEAAGCSETGGDACTGGYDGCLSRCEGK